MQSAYSIFESNLSLICRKMDEQKLGCERCCKSTWEQDFYWKHFSSISFFLSLPQDFHHHLVLPAKFAENTTANLPEKVSLIGPSASVWDVNLIKKTDSIEFGGDGWKQFINAFDLKINDLLVFKYMKNSSFEVLIFDPGSFCEKEASYFVKKSRSGCEGCKSSEEEVYWKHFSTLHFFLSLPNDFHNHLVLPVKFAENMAAKLPKIVSLIGPSATTWDIELIKNVDNLTFGGVGWQEFVKAYDLKEKNLLVFKYTLNSCFEVLIFELESFCEMESSYFVKQCRHTKKAETENKKRTISEAFSVEDIEDEDSDSEFVVSKKSRNDEDKEPQRRKNPPKTPRKLMPVRAPQPRNGPKRTLERCESLSKSKTQSEKEPEENGLVHDMVEDEPEQNGASQELSLCSEREQNARENGGSVLETTHSHRLTEKSGGPNKQLELLDTLSSRKPAVQSAEHKSNRRPATEIEKENVRSRALQGLTETSLMSVLKPSAVSDKFYLNIPSWWMNKHRLHGNNEMVLWMGDNKVKRPPIIHVYTRRKRIRTTTDIVVDPYFCPSPITKMTPEQWKERQEWQSADATGQKWDWVPVQKKGRRRYPKRYPKNAPGSTSVNPIHL